MEKTKTGTATEKLLWIILKTGWELWSRSVLIFGPAEPNSHRKRPPSHHRIREEEFLKEKGSTASPKVLGKHPRKKRKQPNRRKFESCDNPNYYVVFKPFIEWMKSFFVFLQWNLGLGWETRKSDRPFSDKYSFIYFTSSKPIER